MCRKIVWTALGILLIAFGISSFWYSVLNAIASQSVATWSSLFAYALSIIVGIGIAVMGGCRCGMSGCTCNRDECGCEMETKKGRKGRR